MLASALAAFGPIIVCCVAFYLRWQLSDELPSDSEMAAPMPGSAVNGCTFLAGELSPPTAVRGRGAACLAREPEPPRPAGVYVVNTGDAEAVDADAMIRGQLLADRVVSGRFQTRRALRRGKKGALDVIVVGANAVGLSATVHLMHAGLRVLLIDRDPPASLQHPSVQTLLRSLYRKLRNARLPLLIGHSVSSVSERADGMLEVQAERAAWYAANVIFASTEGQAVPGLGANPRSRAA